MCRDRLELNMVQIDGKFRQLKTALRLWETGDLAVRWKIYGLKKATIKKKINDAQALCCNLQLG